MSGGFAFIGFGEAGRTFARPGDRAFDRMTNESRDARGQAE